jgi:hypothetical protein
MQELNRQYEAALKGCDGQKTTGEDGVERMYRYYPEFEQGLVEKIDALLKLKMNAYTTDTWLVGLWLWVKGDTKPYKEQLKELGFRWSPTHTAWYWRDDSLKSRRSGKSLNEIASTYGAEKITEKEEEARQKTTRKPLASSRR